MEVYLGSRKHKENAKEALNKGLENLNKIILKRKENYCLNPSRCLECNEPIKYEKRHCRKFCNSSCAAKYGNKNRSFKISEAQKESISKTLKRKYSTGEIVAKAKEGINNSCKLKYNTCPICEKLFITNSWSIKKACSNECRTILIFKSRKYQNGKRKTILYKNKTQGEILLESTWELKIAKILDNLNIDWIRPKFLKWKDNSNKEHLYYPDFYLTNYNIYLDPKNPYCMEKDKEKMKVIEKKINIIYGNINLIINHILNLGL